VKYLKRFLLVMGVLFLVFILINIIFLLTEPKGSPVGASNPPRRDHMKDTAEVSGQADNPEPPHSNVVVTPPELLKNPFQYKGSLVTLNVQSKAEVIPRKPWDQHPIPCGIQTYTGQAYCGWSEGENQWGEPKTQPKGTNYNEYFFKFNRMTQDNVALYDISNGQGGPDFYVTCDGVPDSSPHRMECFPSNMHLIGQLAVMVPAGTEIFVNQNWLVEPMGTLDGTNGLGAPIQVPIVKFWRYIPLPLLESGCRKGTPTNPNPNCG
jgi:hypothetical protein